MAQQGKVITGLKAQLEGAIEQLKAAQEALVAETAQVAKAAAHMPAVGGNAAGTTGTSNSGNPLREWFEEYTTGPGADKWSGYLDAYHHHFNRFRSRDKVTLVEVGVQSGGSIEMWQSYFGADKLK